MLTVMWYELAGTLEIWKCPALSVVAVRSYWLTGFRIFTVAPGSTAPVGSVTVPVIVPLVAVCPIARQGAAANKLNINKG